MTTKPKITITPKDGKIQFDIRQGNQTRWFSVEEETAKELYQKLGSVLAEQQEIETTDWIEKEMVAFLDRKNTEREHPVNKFSCSSMYGTYDTERQHTPKTNKEELKND